MLSVREKLSLQRAVKEGLNKLKAGVQDIRERLGLQRSVKEMLNKLKNESSQPKKTLYDRLLAGEFNDEKPLAFCDILRDVLNEVGDLKMIFEPVIAYLLLRQKEYGVFEASSTTVLEAIRDPNKLKFLLNEIRGLYGEQSILDTMKG